MVSGDWWLHGLTPAERPGATRPPWARFVDEALDEAPDRAPAGDPTAADGLPWGAAFGLILAPLVEHADRGLPAGTTDAVRAGAAAQLTAGLVRLAVRTLVLELNVARVAGRLTAGPPADRFAQFVALSREPAALRALFAEYPVLARILAQHCRGATEALAELLGRYAADRAEIIAGLLPGADPGPLVAVETMAGDGHQGNRSVAILRFAGGGRVVYKPRSLTVHRHFNDILDRYAGRLPGLGPRALRLLDRDGYGWAEFVAPGPCSSRAGLVRFYRRQGALLALLHVLGGTDIHFENLIARGDEPILIDVETLFQPVLPPALSTGADPAWAALESSVHRTALLPRLILGDTDAVDISGLGGEHGARTPMMDVGWERAGTDRMRLVRTPLVLTGAANRPTRRGADVDPGDFTAALVSGFRAGYAAIAGDREAMLGLLRRCAGDEVRFITRSTRTYATMLAESTHPDLLRDATHREELLGTLRTEVAGDPRRAGYAEAELEDLWAGDVPIFHTRPGSVDAWDSRGRRIAGAFGETGLAAALARVEAMGAPDRKRQEWVIRAALASRDTASGHDARGTGRDRSPAPKDRLLAAAGRIAARVAAEACDDGGRANWLGLEPAGERFWHVGPLGASLGTGYCGVALFLAQLDQVRGRPVHRDLIRRAVRPIPELLAGLAAAPEHAGSVGSGGFAGLGGIAYALTRLAVLLDDPEVGDWADRAVRLTVAATGTEDEPGVITGTAGGLAALLAVHAATGSAPAMRGAAVAAAVLLDRPPPATPGFGHGLAGVGWALLRFGAAGGGAAYTRRGLELLRAADPAGLSWCQGRSGLALAVADSPAAMAVGELAATAESAARALHAAGSLADASLCHGESGALTLLAYIDDKRFLSKMLINAISGTPSGVSSTGILTGISGIGHGALHFAFPEQVPSVLLLA